MIVGLPLGNSKHELGTKNIGHITPLPSHNDHISTTATFVLSPRWPLGRGSTAGIFESLFITSKQI